ncbi:MAG TPA: cupin domain-containing protein [Micromonosporaceae bacterium]|jgi:mannose-6-phosphate isomerase-like protein (cupin superfamily)|nr:cupin domain-containing protein [Micromonosporaceae bacterium]
MNSIEHKTFDKPDETRPFEGKGHGDIVTLAGRPVALGTFEPGWRWSTNVKPIAGTESCQVSHFGYVLSGRMRIMMDDGSTQELDAGDVFAIPPGHDAEVIGDEPCLSLDFGEIGEYAKRK